MKLKVGDKVICKKNFQTDFEKGKSYFISYVYNSTWYIQLMCYHFPFACNITKKTYDKYFYNNKEIRKMKLNVINGI